MAPFTNKQSRGKKVLSHGNKIVLDFLIKN